MKVLTLIWGLMLFASLGACGEDGGSAVANCDAYCNTVASCGIDTAPGCVEDCAQGATGSSACVTAYADTNACIAGLSCQQAQAWVDEIPPESYPCKAQDDAEASACGS